MRETTPSATTNLFYSDFRFFASPIAVSCLTTLRRNSVSVSTTLLHPSQCVSLDEQWRRLHGARAPLLQMAGHEGHHEQENIKEETDQTVLTITNTLTETTNCTFRAKKVERHDPKKISRRFAPDRCPTFAADRCPHFQIRSGATDDKCTSTHNDG